MIFVVVWFLHIDIHELAMEESRRDIGLRKRKSTGIRRRKTKNGEISLRNVNLANLTTEQERHYQALLHEGKKMNRDSVLKLADTASDFFMKEETIVDLRDVSPEQVTIVGDLHGSYKCLDRVLELAGKLEGNPNSYIVFCGDYVDRGENSLEVFCSLLLLKLAYPKNVIMLRGNHEDQPPQTVLVHSCAYSSLLARSTTSTAFLFGQQEMGVAGNH